jgi:hypothetical protein
MHIDLAAGAAEAAKQRAAFDARIRDRLTEHGGEAFKLITDL